jgi:Ribbon-helix-helix protein, copG family
MTRRLQILISDDQYEFLDREAHRSSVSMAELIRRAIDTVFGAKGDRNFVSMTHTLGRRPGRRIP